MSCGSTVTRNPYPGISEHLFELPKFNRSADELQDELERWLYSSGTPSDWTR